MKSSPKLEGLLEKSDSFTLEPITANPTVPRPSQTLPVVLTEGDTRSKLGKLILFTFTFMIVELVGGYMSNSVAIISDALHMGCDTVGYSVQWLSVYISTFRPSGTYTFGFKRGEVLGGIFNCVLIWSLTVFLIQEAIMRLIWPPSYFHPGAMLFTATLGVLLNLTMGGILVGFRNIHRIVNFWEADPETDATENEDYNIRITIMHIRGDMAYSVGVLVSAILINVFPDWIILDSLCTILFSYVVVHITQPIVTSVTRFIMEGVPEDVDAEKVKREFAYIDTVEEVVNFHVWGISEGQNCLMATLRIAGKDCSGVLEKAKRISGELGFSFSTIQVECGEALVN
jgi:cation diffusion facilitator family transporter